MTRSKGNVHLRLSSLDAQRARIALRIQIRSICAHVERHNTEADCYVMDCSDSKRLECLNVISQFQGNRNLAP